MLIISLMTMTSPSRAGDCSIPTSIEACTLIQPSDLVDHPKWKEVSWVISI